jgi:hypothetical protein
MFTKEQLAQRPIMNIRERKTVSHYQQRNPFNIRSAIYLDNNGKILDYYNKLNDKNEIQKIPLDKIEFKKGFEWLNDPDTKAYEMIYGYHITYEDNIYCKMSKLPLDIVGDNYVIDAIQRSHKLGILNSTKSYIPYGNKDTNFNLSECGKVPNMNIYMKNVTFAGDYISVYLPFCYIMTNYEYSQYQSGPRTIESISQWLKEDLTSKMVQDLTKPNRSLLYSFLPNQRFIPYGLMFYNRRLGTFGKILSQYFDWHNMKDELKLDNKEIKTKLNSIIIDNKIPEIVESPKIDKVLNSMKFGKITFQ